MTAARRECGEIWNCRHPAPTMSPGCSKEAMAARESFLEKTHWGGVLEAIKAKDDPQRASKLYADIAAALSNTPHEDDKATVVRLRTLFAQRKPGRRKWQSLLVAYWDELPNHNGEISIWLEQHGERGVSVAAISKFKQRLAVKMKRATN